LREDVEVVAHDAISDHPDFAELLVEPHEPDEFLLFLRTEDELAVHHAGSAVLVGEGMMGRGFESGFAHGKRRGSGSETE